MSKIKPISPAKQVVSGVDTSLRIGSGSGGGIEQWAATKTYTLGDLVIFNDRIWQLISLAPAGSDPQATVPPIDFVVNPPFPWAGTTGQVGTITVTGSAAANAVRVDIGIGHPGTNTAASINIAIGDTAADIAAKLYNAIVHKQTTQDWTQSVNGNVYTFASNKPGGANPDMSISLTPTGPISVGGPAWKEISAVGALKVLDLADVTRPALNVPDDGDQLVYDGNTAHWITGRPTAQLNHWQSTTQYVVGKLVLHDGDIWRCGMNNAGIEPGDPQHEATWERCSARLKLWQPNRSWIKGDIVLAPWSHRYFQSGSLTDIWSDSSGSSIWIARTNMEPGNPGVRPGEPEDVVNIPPGSYRCTHYTKDGATGEWGDPGSSIPYDNWDCVSNNGLRFVEDYQHMVDMVVPMIPGDYVVIAGGARKGWVFLYNCRPGLPSSQDPARARGFSLQPFKIDMGESGNGILGPANQDSLSLQTTTITGPIQPNDGLAQFPQIEFVKVGTAYDQLHLNAIKVLDLDGAQITRALDPTNDQDVATAHWVKEELKPLVTGIRHGAAVSAILAIPPANPVSGDLYIVSGAPTGAFAGKAHHIAQFVNGAWQFTAPGTNEAHLVQADNSIYHWSGTAWNKIGTTGVSQLNDISDVEAAGGHAPTDGQVLTWVAADNKWEPKPVFVPGAPMAVRAHIPSTQGKDQVIDLGTKDWSHFEMSGIIEVQDTASVFTFNLQDGNDVDIYGKTDCEEYSDQLMYGSTPTYHSYYTSQHWTGENRLPLTWLPASGNTNDKASSGHNYHYLRIIGQRMYDDYTVFTIQFNYHAYVDSPYDYRIRLEFKPRAIHKEARVLKLYGSSNSRYVFNGIVTVV